MKEILLFSSKSRNNAGKRLNLIYDLCKAKRICEGGDELEIDQSELADENEIDPEQRKKKVSSYRLN